MFAVRRLKRLAQASFRPSIASLTTRRITARPPSFISYAQTHSDSNGPVTNITSQAGNKVELRPYQESCLQACMDVLNIGTSRIGVSLPTGSGKTTVFLSLITRMQPPENNPSATRALIIVNSIELATQASEQLKRLFPDLTVEIEQGTRHKASGTADVYVAFLLLPQS